jgi:bacterioferritin-associated ferredoxin
MADTPLEPDIRMADNKFLTVCNCCGVQDKTIKPIHFGWVDRSVGTQSGSTIVALCFSCRKRAAKVLLADLPSFKHYERFFHGTWDE